MELKSKHTRKFDLPFSWPNPPFEIVLVEPEIPPNTGNIARLCAATDSPLHLIDPLGFKLTSSSLKRAGLDYWNAVDVQRHENLKIFLENNTSRNIYFFSTGGKKNVFELQFKPGDIFIFGNETKGLSDDILKKHPNQIYGIPMCIKNVRSLNLANAVSIVLYEALRQIQRS